MTKVTILGETQGDEPKKKIEFLYTCAGKIWINANASDTAEALDEIELIAHNFTDGMDLMFGFFNNQRNLGVLYLGHFNDGIV